jgi:hypothetical protein
VWQAAIDQDGTPLRFRVDTRIEPNETIGVTVDVGISSRAQEDLATPAVLRASVDSCTFDGDPSSPPCRILESKEDDNDSAEFTFFFVLEDQ